MSLEVQQDAELEKQLNHYGLDLFSKSPGTQIACRAGVATKRGLVIQVRFVTAVSVPRPPLVSATGDLG